MDPELMLMNISSSTGSLENSLGDTDAQSRNYLSPTSRMMNLIRNVLAYSQLAKEQQLPEAVDLNVIAQSTVADFDLILDRERQR